MKGSFDLYRLLQFNGGTFPTGGFSQSWGLETYVAEGLINDADGFWIFLETYLVSGVGRCEGPILLRAYDLAEAYVAISQPAERRGVQGSPAKEPAADVLAELRSLEQLSGAIKVTYESRQAQIRMGRAFLRILKPILDDESRQWLDQLTAGGIVTYPVVYGIACSLLAVDRKEALAAYIFSTANTLCQSALKLIPLGNVEAQKVMFDMGGFFDRVLSLCEETPVEEITNFCPGIDIASLRHEHLPVRLYMS